ncbi:MAG: ATP-binding cassette domain-containing protein [Bryobacteraceae bacterium]
MIQLTGAKHFGPKTLFENSDWLVTPNERAGIVGANGTGKSTLLKILAGMDSLDAGTVVTMKGASVGTRNEVEGPPDQCVQGATA